MGRHTLVRPVDLPVQWAQCTFSGFARVSGNLATAEPMNGWRRIPSDTRCVGLLDIFCIFVRARAGVPLVGHQKNTALKRT